MSGLQQIAKLGGKLASLDDVGALLGELSTVAAQFSAIRAELANLGKAIHKVDDLVGLIWSGQLDAPVETVFKTLGLDTTIAKLRAARDVLKKDDRVARLLSPTGAFSETPKSDAVGIWDYGTDDGLVALKLFDKQIAGAPSGGQFTFEASGEAELACEAGALWPYKSDAVSQHFLRLGARAAVGAGASVSTSLMGVKLGVGGSASANCSLQYFFVPSSADSIFALDAGRAIAKLPSPFDFDQIWSALTAPDLGETAQPRLSGVTIALEGETEIGVTIGIGQDITASDLLKASLDLTFSASLKRSGKYDLSLIAGPLRGDPDGTVRVVLSNTDGSDKRFAIGLGLTIDLTGLGRRVNKILLDALKKWEDGLETVQPFLSPGTYLRSQIMQPVLDGSIQKLIGDATLSKALAADISVALGVDAGDNSKVEEWLREKILHAVTHASGVLAKEGGKVDTVVNRLLESLPALATDQLKPLVEGELTKLITKVDENLKGEVTKLVTASPLDRGDVLRKLGAAVNGKVTKLDETLKGVRDLIAKYDALFHRIVAAAGEQARQKISLRLNWEQQKVDRVELETVGTFLKNTAESKKIFDSLVAGKLDELAKLYTGDGHNADNSFLLNTQESSSRRFAQVSKKFGYELVLFGIGSSGDRLKLGDASLFVKGDGTLRLDASSEFTVDSKRGSEERSLSLFNAYSIVNTKTDTDRLPETRQAMRASFEMLHDDGNLEKKECDAFFDNLRTCGLITDSATTRAKARFTEWSMTGGGNQKISGRLSLHMNLPANGADLLMCLDLEPSGELNLASQHMLGRLAIDAMIRSNDWEKKNLDHALEVAIKNKADGVGTGPDTWGQDRILDHVLGVALNAEGKVSKDHKDSMNDAMKRAFKFVLYVKKMREIYLAKPDAGAVPTNPALWKAEDYRKAELELAGAAEIWIKTNKKFLGSFKATMHPTTSALMIALVAAANRPANTRVRSLAETGVHENDIGIYMSRKDKHGTLTAVDTF